MEIKTKFSIGDTVYTIKDFKILSFKVGYIFASINQDCLRIHYGKSFEDSIFESYEEKNCFKDKDELISSLD